MICSSPGAMAGLKVLGGRGVISVTTNVAPRAMQDMCAAAVKGDAKTAGPINNRLMGLHRHLFVEANPIPVKWALARMGRIGNGIRLPLTPLSESQYETVLAARANLQQAEKVLEMTENNYKYGAATPLDILDSQTAVSVARTT